MTDSHVVIGAGGHAKVVVATLLELGATNIHIYDDDAQLWGGSVLGAPVVGGVDRLTDRRDRAILAIGDNGVRRRLADRLTLDWVTLVHPRAYVHPSVRLEHGTVVFAGSVIQADASIGAHVIVNTGATVDHDCRLDDFVHIAPGVHLAGSVHVAQSAFLGIASAVLPGLRIGENSILGAGAVCVEDLPPNVIAVGIPARARALQRAEPNAW